MTLPARIGKYAVIRRIASGGMADVYLCRHKGSEGFRKDVAVKVIRPHLLEEPRFRDLFVTEARLAASLSHPNLVHVFDFGKEGDSCYLVMEHVRGWNLAQAAAQMRLHAVPIPLEVWRCWIEGLLSGIGYLHARGVVHRDISPSNVLLSRGGTVKIADFGIARSVRWEAVPTDIRQGKIGYMSPEQARGEDATFSSDLFAAAVVAAELFLPGRLFGGEAESVILERIRAFDGCQLPAGSLPPEVEGIIRKGLAGRREDRHGTADEFRRGVCTAVPSVAGSKDLDAFWDSLFPAEEDETVGTGFPHQAGKGNIVGERKGRYGQVGLRGIKVGAAVVLVASAVGVFMAWKGPSEKTSLSPPVAPTSGLSDGAPPSPSRTPLPPRSPSATARSSLRVEPVPGTPGVETERRLPQSGDGTSRSLRDEETGGRDRETRVAGTAAGVHLETDPPGVAVNLDDGTPLGKTPLFIDLTPMGGRKIVFEKEGFGRKLIPVDTLSRLQRFRMEMERQMGTVEAVQAIPWAKVYEGDRYLGETPFPLTLSVGEHRLRFVNEPLGIERTETLFIRPGANPKLVVPLIGKK